MPSDEEVLLQQEDARRAAAGEGNLIAFVAEPTVDSTVALLASRAASGSTCALCFHPSWLAL